MAFLHFLNKWILTWLKAVETVNEYNISKARFDVYVQGNDETLGQVCTERLNNLVNSIHNKKEIFLIISLCQI
jgi:hypothetical protein